MPHIDSRSQTGATQGVDRGAMMPHGERKGYAGLNDTGRGNTTGSQSQAMPHLPTRWRVAGSIAIVLVLAAAFAGYLSPDMRVQWANFMSLCGF